MTTVNWIICWKSTLSDFFGGILVNFKSHLLFLGVAGDSHKRWSHFNRIEFRPKRLNMRTLSTPKPVWLRGFCVRPLAGSVRVSLRCTKIHWICNRFLVTTVNWIIYIESMRCCHTGRGSSGESSRGTCPSGCRSSPVLPRASTRRVIVHHDWTANSSDRLH